MNREEKKKVQESLIRIDWRLWTLKEYQPYFQCLKKIPLCELSELLKNHVNEEEIPIIILHLQRI